jgi:hypothetical protein
MTGDLGGRTRAAQARNDYLIQEIEFLLMCDVGEHAIAQALNVKARSLERKLHRIGRTDLIPRIFSHQAALTEARQHSAEYFRIAYNESQDAA